MTRHTIDHMSRIAAAALDVVVVLVFVGIGRSAHDEPLAGMVGTAAPFLMALAASWAITAATPWPTVTVQAGVIVWAVTWVGGLALRQLVFGAGTAPAFVVVAGISLATGLLGWRLVATLLHRREPDKEKPRDTDGVPG